MAKINYIGHATVLVDIGRIRVLTDPILRDRVFFLQRHGQNPAPDLLTGRGPNVVLISHMHHDHADLPSLRQLPSTTLVVAPRGSGRYLKRWAGVEVHEVQEGDHVQVADVEITALPANHTTGHSGLRPEGSLGYVLRNRLSVYFAGDTDLFDGMHEIGEEFDLDLALMPVWGYSYHVGPGHLNPLTAAQALRRLQPRIAIPIHWGALRLPGPQALWEAVEHIQLPPHSFAAHAKSLAPQTEVRVLQPGEWTSIN